MSSASTERIPQGHLKVDKNVEEVSIFFASWYENSCHWNCMIPSFIALQQFGLLPSELVTSKARNYFNIIRDAADGVTKPMTSPVEVSEYDAR